jgi:hypothetical protein
MAVSRPYLFPRSSPVSQTILSRPTRSPSLSDSVPGSVTKLTGRVRFLRNAHAARAIRATVAGATGATTRSHVDDWLKGDVLGCLCLVDGCVCKLECSEELGEEMEWLAAEGTPSFIDLAMLRDLIDLRHFPSQLPL